MEINVTNVKLKEVHKIIKQFKKLYSDVHLKSSRTKTGKRVCVVFHKMKKR